MWKINETCSLIHNKVLTNFRFLRPRSLRKFYLGILGNYVVDGKVYVLQQYGTLPYKRTMFS
jgi:hypothetical protein